jgi:streptogramin lyase
MTGPSTPNRARLRAVLLGVALMASSASSGFAGTGRPGKATETAGPTTSALGVAGFFTLPPCRVVDTRAASGVPLGRPSLAAGVARVFSARRLCGLPDNAIAVSFNVTVTAPSAAGDLRIFPGGGGAPLASVINYGAGQTRANNGIVPIGADGSIVVLCDQASGVVDLILDVNGYFVGSPDVPTPKGLSVRIRPATEVELTFDNVTSTGGTTAVRVLEFPENRTRLADQSLKLFFPPGSPEQAFVPDVVVPGYVTGIGKGGPGGTPTFLLAIVDTTNLAFSRTAEFHGLEDFRLGWDPPCVVPTNATLEPRTFYAREALKNEPVLSEERLFGGPAFVDISSGCGSNKGSGWNFSAYLTGRDTRTPDQIAQFMLLRMQDALGDLSAFILDRTLAANLAADVQSALTNLTPAPATSMANMADFIGLVDGNPTKFNNTTRNVAGEFDGRAQAATYMIKKLVPTGTFAEFAVPTASAGLGRIALGPDGNLWFTEGSSGANRIGRVTRAGVVTEFPVPTPNSNPYGIAAGPDGNVWFTEGNTGKIGRITPTGVVTEFPVPSGSASRVLAITTGPDGNLWFTGLNSNKVGRVTLPGGSITEFAVPSPVSGPYGIVTGPDGNLWFTESNVNQIGVITPAGVVVKEFPVSGVLGTNTSPYGLTVGPDGNVWFVESTGSEIGFITPGGAITKFPLPAGSGPAWLTTAPDGNIWFTEDTAGKIGRITPAGVPTHFVIPTPGSKPYGIVVGPDGNLWFTEGTGNKIGRITP